MFNRPPNSPISEEEQKKRAAMDLLNKWSQKAQESLKQELKDTFISTSRQRK